MNLLQGLDLGDGLLLVLAASRDTYHEIGPSTRARVVRRGLHAKATGRMPLAAAQDKPALPVAMITSCGLGAQQCCARTWRGSGHLRFWRAAEGEQGDVVFELVAAAVFVDSR